MRQFDGGRWIIDIQQLGYGASSSRRYITNEQGERVGILLDLDEYHQLTRSSVSDPEFLVGLSEPELQALAQSTLATDELVI